MKESDLLSALKIARYCKYLKLILGMIIIASYFWFSTILLELIVFSVVISLALPMGFSDTFLVKKIEYERSLLEERQLLNASEANDHFKRLFDRTDSIRQTISGYGYKQ